MKLEKYCDIPFDYEDKITNEIFNIEYNLMLLEDNPYKWHPATLEYIIIDSLKSLSMLKAMVNIPDKVLDEGVKKWS